MKRSPSNHLSEGSTKKNKSVMAHRFHIGEALPPLPPRFPPNVPLPHLDTCLFCKKKITEHRYMNGGLEAFCSDECRNKAGMCSHKKEV
ncbi:FCS-Like zinc finger 13 [Tanacetum coccineum]